jgi:dienelactone hydrolase
VKLGARVLFGAASLVYLAACVWLARAEQAGPVHADLELAGRIPATFYLPELATPGRSGLPDPPPRGERPPVVALVHGFSSDRVAMSSLARRIAASGYAVLAIDVRGHGTNPNPFPEGRGRPDALAPDLAAAVDFLRVSPWVDGSRIVVMGHSMGASAALDFATRDSALAGVVPISGGSGMNGPQTPHNALFIWAAGDPPGLGERAAALAGRLAGVDSAEPGRTYGDVTRGTAVRAVEVPGVDHLTILFSGPAATEIVAWLDGVFGTQRAEAPPLAEPRLAPFGIAIAAATVLLAGVGWVSGRLARGLEERAARGGALGLAAVAGALLVAMPILAIGVPASFLALAVGDVVASLLAIAGSVLLVALALRGDTGRFPALRGVVAGGAAGFLAVYVLLMPLDVVGHHMALAPGRLLPFAGMTLLVLPFFVAFEALLRRGRPATATLLGVAGRIVLLGMIFLGVQLGVVPFVVVLMLPTLALLFLLVEVFAAGCYVASGNWLVIALVESAWLAWSTAVTSPLTGG